jgi:hypothetical protein|tara:strand:+ start:1821 stop:2267 length:447 start_codon:yes stop_codon:yes gene_type:complete
MKLILYILLSSILLACAPQARFTRLIEKYPHLLTTDSITVIDTFQVFVPKVVHDTVYTEHFFHEITKDTLVIQKDRLRIEIYHDTIKKNVYIKGECDTITVEKIVERTIPIKYYEKTPLWKKIINWLIIAVLLYGAYRLYLFLKKRLL